MNLKSIFRIALVRGLTAKEAGAEFGVRWDSLHKVGKRHKLPPLITEYEKDELRSLNSMTTQELRTYICILGESNNREREYAEQILDERGIKNGKKEIRSRKR